jgi:CheY-like chemotaxis protein
MVAAEFLREAGHEVLLADNGRQALKVLNENPDLDAVLMDIQMPEMDGIEVTRRIRSYRTKCPPDVTIIALTAYAMPEEREKFESEGMDAHIPKPLIYEDLDRQVREAVHKKRTET